MLRLLRARGLAYRESGLRRPPVLLVHATRVLLHVAHCPRGGGRSGPARHCPHLAGFGDSEPEPARHVGAPRGVDRALAQELGHRALRARVHDWGGRSACAGPASTRAIEALVISSTGFFPYGKWHGMAEALRTPGTGEQLVEAIDRDGFAGLHAFAGPPGRRRDRRVLEGLRRRGAPPRSARSLPLGDSRRWSNTTSPAWTGRCAVWGRRTSSRRRRRPSLRERAGRHRARVIEERHFVWETPRRKCANRADGLPCQNPASSDSST